jgi:hypothetical protein
MTFPAWPRLPKISLVDEMFNASRNRVVIKSIEGKMENSRGPLINMVVSNIISEAEMLTMNIKSRKNAGKGMIIKAIIITMNITTTLLNSFISSSCLSLCCYIPRQGFPLLPDKTLPVCNR